MCAVKLGVKERLKWGKNGHSEPFAMINLLVYLINSEQIGISEQFCDDQKVPYYPVHSELEWNFCVGFSWEGLQVTHMVFAYHWTS